MHQRQKGSRGELQVAKLLLCWWRQVGEVFPVGHELVFRRTPGSGGWQGAHEFRACGDIMTNSASFPFSVEVKRVQNFSLSWFVEGRKSPVWGFWRQCQVAAECEEREPMLWFRQNHRPWMVLIRRGYAERIRGLAPPDVAWSTGLALKVDCWQVPVLYLSTNLLGHSPRIFT